MVKEEHCDRNSLLSVDTDDVAAHGAQSAQDGPQRLNNQQKQKVVGKNLNLVLLTTLVCVDSLTSRERGRKVGTGTIPSSPRIYQLTYLFWSLIKKTTYVSPFRFLHSPRTYQVFGQQAPTF